MTATLTFSLPEESAEHRDALNGTAYKSVLCTLDEQLRTWLKHGHKFTDPAQAIGEMRTLLNDELSDEHLSLYD